MSHAVKLLAVVLLCAQRIPAQTAAPEGGAKAIVLQKNEGELRTRRPREWVASPSSDFLLKVSPKTNGSKHLLLGTEEIPPGAVGVAEDSGVTDGTNPTGELTTSGLPVTRAQSRRASMIKLTSARS